MDTNTDIKYTHTDGECDINVDKFIEACEDNKLEYIPHCTYLPDGIETLDGSVRGVGAFMLHMVVKDPYGNRIHLHSNSFKPIENKK